MKEKLSIDIRENIAEIRKRVALAAQKAGRDPSEITIEAVTKTVPAECVNVAIEEGILVLGENRAQELLSKVDNYTKSAKIHFIGALQSNKVRQIIDYVTMIESVDRISLAAEINRQAEIRNQEMDILIEVNVAGEASKSGVEPNSVLKFYDHLKKYSAIKVRGLMAIPPITDNLEQLGEYFSTLRQLLVDIQQKNCDNSDVNILSMGMSGDFETAIAYGSTIVRIGTALFGARN